MSRYKIEGGNRLSGTVYVHGAKNAALPILAATIINRGKSVIHNCPDLSDVSSIISILEMLGCTVNRKEKTLFVDSSGFTSCKIPLDAMRETRSSTLFAGAMIARCQSAFISGSGGCCIGKRPIDMHLSGFEKMGIEVCSKADGVQCKGGPVGYSHIKLTFPSVGATENLMLAASVNTSMTIISNAAKEPEIVNLAEYLRSVGVKINGDGTGKIIIRGTRCFKDGEVTIIPDRIVASTYIASVACAGGEITVENVNPAHLSSVIGIYRRMGLSVRSEKSSLHIKKNALFNNLMLVNTEAFPGFPTDCQPLLVASMATAAGVGFVREKIFENRLSHCGALNRMGADLHTNGSVITVNGVRILKGADIDAHDLRCGAALCAAALGAEGTSYVNRINYIERGYENLCTDLAGLGALIERID